MKTAEPKDRSYPRDRRDLFPIILLVSILIHGIGLFIVAFRDWSQSATSEPEKYDPIEFVTVPPEAEEPAPETQRRALNNSIAQGKVEPERNIDTDTGGDETPPVAESESTAIAPPAPVEPPQSITPEIEEPPAPIEPPQSITPEIEEPPAPIEPPQPITPPEIKEPLAPIEPIQPSTLPEIKEPLAPIEPIQPSTLPEIKEPLAKPETSTNESQPESVAESDSESLAPSKLDAPTVAARSPQTPQPPVKPVEPQPNINSGAASLLGGSYKRGTSEDVGNSFFDPQIVANKEAPYAKLDAQQDSSLGPYFAEIKRRVKRNWNPSAAYNDRRTVIVFSIQSNGQITGLRVVQTSGSDDVDRRSLEAIQKSAPFPPIPEGIPQNSINVEFDFNIYVHYRY